MRRVLSGLAWGSCVGLSLVACATGPAATVRPIAPAASEAFHEAQRLWRMSAGAQSPERSAALDAARVAAELAPDWPAPRRFLDDRAREDLLGPDVLGAHRKRIAAEPTDALAHYLAARLEGEAGVQRFERAVECDPGFAWGHHGLAWAAERKSGALAALPHERRALKFARDNADRISFATSLARLHRSKSDYKRAARVLEELLESPTLRPAERVRVAVELASSELAAKEREMRDRGARRALRLIAEAELSEDEVRRLGARFSVLALARYKMKLILALSRQSSPARDGLRASLLLQDQRTPLALEQLVRAAEREGRVLDELDLRVLEFAVGDPERAVETWRSGLPGFLLDAEGLPRDERLARVVRAARDELDAEGSKALGEALIAAGWFDEARGFAARLGAVDVEYAARLEERAFAGHAAVKGITRLALAAERSQEILDQSEPEFRLLTGAAAAHDSESDDERDPGRLADLLGGMGRVLAHSNAFLGGETDADRLARALVQSPAIGYGIAGSLVHPGPNFSEQDARLGRGPAGTPVPGLAPELMKLGRFGLFGDTFGSKVPDGTLLRIVLLEERAGEHLGRPWSGTLAWCEGTDLEGRAARRGAAIGGAALHEGYWIDLATLRAEHHKWELLRRRFTGPGAAERVADALSVNALPVTEQGDDGAPAPATRTEFPLGEASRVRLAVLVDRGRSQLGPETDGGTAEANAGTGLLGSVSFDEVVSATAVHEEAHLCDRARFYPIGEHLNAVLFFLIRSGFSPLEVGKRLEYRAQLVALCEVDDPRLPLIDLLEAVENGSNGATPHAVAYEELLQDFLRELDRACESAPAAWPAIERERLLVQQMHRLAPDEVRELALVLARREGLVRD